MTISKHSINSRKFLTEDTCSICGKTFIPAPEHIYKVARKSDAKVLYQCSYTCYKKAKEQNARRSPTNHVVSAEKQQRGGRKKKNIEETRTEGA